MGNLSTNSIKYSKKQNIQTAITQTAFKMFKNKSAPLATLMSPLQIANNIDSLSLVFSAVNGHLKLSFVTRIVLRCEYLFSTTKSNQQLRLMMQLM